MKENIIFVYAHWEGMAKPQLVGSLFAQKGRSGEIFSFSYDASWLSSKANSYQLDPELQLFAGRQYPNPSKSNFGLFLDSTPDRWGRKLMQRRQAIFARSNATKYRPLTESDYLLGVQDIARMGALRFKLDQGGPFIAEDSPFATPPWTRLRDLEYGVSQLEGNPDSDEEARWIARLVDPGSSLGGARPKATVADEQGNLWIAKFPSRNDTNDSGAWEMVVHELASNAGVEVPPAMLQSFSSQGGTFIVRRFDRTKTTGRIHFASAMALLGKQDGDHSSSYLELAEFITTASAQPDKDLHQLWRRIAFSIAISNTDDHLRNHGFLLTRKGWKLSPAYDLNPSPNSYGLSLAIDEVDHSLDFSLALKQAPFFHLSNTEAAAILEEVSDSVCQWKQTAKKYGLSSSACMQMESAFRLDTR
ncbi:MAG: type II toxin-antitoxin system HipA family toxin [Sphaerochaeta sp.]|nr:type II toxin-antitoxin system HipA family toxin [Sphaerochaeta sp.]